MTFKNEYIPPIEEETSEFLKKARQTLGQHFVLESWTVDRPNNMVLNWRAGGREFETRNDEGWDYIDSTGQYSFWTRLDSQEVLSPQEIAMTRTITTVWEDSRLAGMPSKETWKNIKRALEARKDFGVRSKFNTCKLTLILNGEAV